MAELEDYIISGVGVPTTSTVGTVGKFYKNTSDGTLYICTKVSSSGYTWELSVANLTYTE